MNHIFEFNPYSISFLKPFLKNNGIFLSRNRGQNFLVDRNIAEKIIENVPDNSIVFEVGAGLGALTFPLSEKVSKLYAIEIDRKIYNILERFFEVNERVFLFNEDFLKFDMKRVKEENLLFISNLPYSISGEAIKKFIEEEKFQSGIVMLQKEFVDRMLATSLEKNYGALSILSYFYLDVEKLFSVSKNCFFPIPEVDSMVVRLMKKKYKFSQKDFANFLKIAFSKRRKFIQNSLKELGFSKSDIIACGISLDLRPENLSPENWATLFEYYQFHKSRAQ